MWAWLSTTNPNRHTFSICTSSALAITANTTAQTLAYVLTFAPSPSSLAPVHNCLQLQFILLGPELGTCKDPFVFQMILYYLFFSLPEHTTPQNSPNLKCKSHLAKNVIIYCCPEFPPLGGTVIKESSFWLMTPIYFVAHSKTLYVCISQLCDSWYRPRLFMPTIFFFAMSQNVENLLFRTFTDLHETWHTAKLLKLLDNNFLQIWFKTGRHSLN